MKIEALEAIKGATLTLLNTRLQSMGLGSVRAVELSDDLEYVRLMHQSGAIGAVRSEIILCEEMVHAAA